jgi:hypothetical protein
MNERIRQLAKESGFDWHKYWNDDESNRLEKFAELLLKDVAQFVEDKFDFCGDELIVAEQILKHFGVKDERTN